MGGSRAAEVLGELVSMGEEAATRRAAAVAEGPSREGVVEGFPT